MDFCCRFSGMHNTLVYLSLVSTSAAIAATVDTPLGFQIGCFFALYYGGFFFLEFLDIIVGVDVWKQHERTSECYDWFQHYLKKDYGYINGKHVFDYSENIYYNDFNTSTEKSLQNKYELVFKELNLSSGKTLLDCGCGIGTWMQYCQERGVKVTGLTLSKEQQLVCEKRGLTAYVQDYRIFQEEFVQKFDAISLLGSTEHVSVLSGGLGGMMEKSYRDYKSVFSVLKQYLKPSGKMLLTVLVQCKPKKEWCLYDYVQCHILQRHYGGYYSKTEVIHKAITDNGFTVDSVKDYTKDYHWISVAEPDHFGHWWIHWNENLWSKIAYFFRGLVTDPFLLHHWLYYWLDSWMYHLGGYQTTPLTYKQVEGALTNLKYYSISL